MKLNTETIQPCGTDSWNRSFQIAQVCGFFVRMGSSRTRIGARRISSFHFPAVVHSPLPYRSAIFSFGFFPRMAVSRSDQQWAQPGETFVQPDTTRQERVQ